jgi:hypothetical protein
MKKITSQKFSKKLASYGALSMAIAGLTDASGQIVYTDVDPDFAGGVTIDYGLDLNNDGTIDFNIDAGTVSSGMFFAVQMDNNGITGNSVLGSEPSYIYPFALDAGAPVSSGQTSFYSSGTLNFASCYLGNGGSNWCGVADKFLGLKFQVDGNTHYGWARLDLSASGDSFTVKDYAYNSVPDEAIVAGQTLSLEDNKIEGFTSFVSNDVLTLKARTPMESLTIHNISGQELISRKLSNATELIDLSALSTGVYIATVSVEGKLQAIKFVR